MKLLHWMTELGFRKVLATWNGGSTFTGSDDKEKMKRPAFIFKKNCTAKFRMDVPWLDISKILKATKIYWLSSSV